MHKDNHAQGHLPGCEGEMYRFVRLEPSLIVDKTVELVHLQLQSDKRTFK